MNLYMFIFQIPNSRVVNKPHAPFECCKVIYTPGEVYPSHWTSHSEDLSLLMTCDEFSSKS